MNIILGLVVIILGFLMTWKSEPVFNFTGSIEYFERKLGSTRSGIKLVGVVMSLVGMLIFSGLINDIMESFVGLFVRK